MKFKPFYVFKCFTTTPIIYLFPQYLLDYIIQKHTKLPFYEYYFEQHSDKNFYYNHFFEGIGMYPNGIISMELITFYREILQEIMQIALL